MIQIVGKIKFEKNWPVKIVNGTKVIDYNAWINRIKKNWPGPEIKRDLTKMF